MTLQHDFPHSYWCLVGNVWVAGGCWDDEITSDYGSLIVSNQFWTKPHVW